LKDEFSLHYWIKIWKSWNSNEKLILFKIIYPDITKYSCGGVAKSNGDFQFIL